MMHFRLVQYLADRGYLKAKSKIMDIGTQNILFVEMQDATEFIKKLRCRPLTEFEMEELSRICYFSTPRPEERTSFLHELLALTDCVYESVDIVDGLKTTIFDLNFDAPFHKWRNNFDLIINCGTLEHIINQYNSFNFIHSLLKVGGYWFDQPASIGFLNHGYFNYNPMFYLDFAVANEYDVAEAWYSHADQYPAIDVRFPVINVDELHTDSEREKISKMPFVRNFNSNVQQLASYNFNVAMRKTVDKPMRLPLEVRTTHAPLGNEARARYGGSVFDSSSHK